MKKNWNDGIRTTPKHLIITPNAIATKPLKRASNDGDVTVAHFHAGGST
ncbi:MAG: hypothetical protein HN467_00535 [Opitutae bacterium]|nr:hypothetical protein [Opitutae bacterium]